MGLLTATVLPFVMAAAAGASAPSAADYERAARFDSATLEQYVLNGELRYAWLGAGERFYYLRRTAGGKEFVLVDANSARRRPAFDHGRLARALAAATATAVDPANLPFDWVEFVQGERAIELDSREKRWHCALGGACRQIERVATVDGVVSPDGKWSVVRKGANVWLRSLRDGTERALTTDGTPDLTYGGRDGLGQMLGRWPPVTEALWSPDSRRVVFERMDIRGVPPRYHLQEVPEDGSLLPKLFAPRVALPGDSITERVDALVFLEIATGARIEVRHDSFPRNAYTLLGDFPKRIQWRADSRTALVMPSEPSRKVVRLLEIDSGTGAIRPLVEESSATYVDPESGMAGKSLLGGGEILWRSERSNWSHLYLYDRNGKLKNAITEGEWRVAEIARVDESRRRVYFTATGREPGEDPYQKHLYVVNLDGSGLRLLTPENAHHVIDVAKAFSPSGRYFIETFSRPDLAPVTVLRDRQGREVLKLETADVTRLEASGFVRPEPFRVLAADGATPIHGNLFRPATLDPSRCYPVVDVIYPGPHNFRTRKSFMEAMRDEAQALAELGFVVVTMDGRGTAGRSKSFHDVAYGNLQQAGNLADHVAGFRQLAQRYPYMDLERVGASGWSAGGFAATRALLEHPEFYKVATSSAGDQDVRAVGPFPWATIYQGPFSEATWSPLVNARLAQRLQGKLLLIQGDMDTAVHPAVNSQFITALIAANKHFDLLVVPNAEHKVHFDPYVARRRMDYFVEHLGGPEARPCAVNGLSPQQRTVVEKLITGTMKRNDVPGLTAAIALDGKLAWSAGYGLADVENSVPATTRTKIRTASISKWLTATAAMRLVEEGKLDLEATPQSYCKTYPTQRWPMKVSQILNHTAGIRHYHGDNGEPQDTAAQRQALEEQQRQERQGQFIRYTDTTGPLKAFKDDPLVFEPGTRYHYTSNGYRLLGCVLAGASGESYSALLARTVLGPAQMRDTVPDDAEAIIPNRAAGYVADAAGKLRRADFRDVSENLPAGGHLSTAQDLVSFALAFNGGKLVSPKTIQQMRQRPSVAGEQDPERYYGSGIQIGMRGNLLGHTGSQTGTSTCLASLPDIGFAVAVMMNKEAGNSGSVCEGIREALVPTR